MAENKSRELVAAVMDSDFVAADALLAAGANPNCRTPGGRTMLEVALLNDDMATFRRLLDGGVNINARGSDGHTLLYYTLVYSNLEAMRCLVSRGARFIRGSPSGAEALMKAVGQWDEELVGFLIAAGADVNCESNGRRPLIAAIEEGSTEAVRLLLDGGADTNVMDSHDGTPIICAIRRMRPDLVPLLLEWGADSRGEFQHTTPLVVAAGQDNLEVVKLLIENGADPDRDQWLSAARMDKRCGPEVKAFLDNKYARKSYRESVNEERARENAGEDARRVCHESGKEAKANMVKIKGIGFGSVVGMEGVKQELRRDILHHLKHPELAKEYGLSMRGGIMLYGPPGCGKTFITKALAGESGVNFIEASISDVLDKYVGTECQAIKRFFAKARKSAPCILFFDEIDLLGGNRNNTGESVWAREGVTALLTELDGASASNEGLLVIGATNAPWMVDPALKRSGRLGKALYVPPPDGAMREGLFRMYLKGKPVKEDMDYARLAAESARCNAADIPAICNEAAKLAWDSTIVSGVKRKISMADMECCLKKGTRNMNEWFDQAKQYMATETNRDLYSELNESLKQQETVTQGVSYR